MNNGPNWWLLELADAQAVRQATPDLAAITRLTQISAATGLAIYAPDPHGDADLVVRAFCPGDGIPEDPVTGSANACIAARLHGEGRLPGTGCAMSPARAARSAAMGASTSTSMTKAKCGLAERRDK